jgi:hypothetical protein
MWAMTPIMIYWYLTIGGVGSALISSPKLIIVEMF